MCYYVTVTHSLNIPFFPLKTLPRYLDFAESNCSSTSQKILFSGVFPLFFFCLLAAIQRFFIHGMCDIQHLWQWPFEYGICHFEYSSKYGMFVSFSYRTFRGFSCLVCPFRNQNGIPFIMADRLKLLLVVMGVRNLLPICWARRWVLLSSALVGPLH